MARASYDSDSSDNEYCEEIRPEDPVDQVNPFGKYICGTQANHNFEIAKRPEITGECPSGYVMCSANTSKDTGICVLESEEEECPINDISFESDSSFDVELSRGNSYWTELTYANGKKLRFSKKGSGLPIHSGKIQPVTPCMVPDHSPKDPSGVYYPTEVALVQGCSESRLTGHTSDRRYINLNMEASQYDVQFHSGVMNTIAR